MNSLHEEITPLPDRIKSLAVHTKGYPVPYFVKYIDSKPGFRITDPEKSRRCVFGNLC